MSKPGKLIVFSAPSGAGKSTLKDALMKRFPSLRYSVSATTRKPRPGEYNGTHYFFKSMDEFRIMIENEELVEHMLVHGNYYGTPCAPIEKSLADGFSVIFDLDVYGKVKFDEVFPNAIGILITPPNLEELERRLVARKSDDSETIRVRLQNASQELEFAARNGKYEYTVVNDNFDHALEELTKIMEKVLGQRRKSGV